MNNFNQNISSLFESRDRSLTKINEAVDFLSRSTRENLAVLKVDNEKNTLSLVSESDNLVSCSFEKDNDDIRLYNFKTTNLEEVLSDEYMDSVTKSKVSDFVHGIKEGRYTDANTSFDDLLASFSDRSNAAEYRAQVQKAKDSLDKNIFDPQGEKFSQIQEMKDSIKGELEKVEEFDIDVVNALKLNNAISKAYNLPKQEITNLSEMRVPNNSKSDLYQMICENELVRKEIINAKGNLAKAWHNNEFISELASCIYEDESKIEEKLIGVVTEIPYFALASKGEIQEVLASTYDVINPGTVSTKDIKGFTSKIFELKKPVKEVIVEMLNAKYGININNLKMLPSFKTLSETQSSLFNLLSEHVTKGSVSQKIMKEFSSHMRNKSGVSVLDVSDFIADLFEDVRFADEELNHFMKPINLTEAIKDMLNDKEEEEEGSEEADKPDAKKIKAVAKKAKDLAAKMKGEKPEDKEGDDAEADKEGDDAEADMDGDGDVDKIDKKIAKEKDAIEDEKDEKAGKDEKKKKNGKDKKKNLKEGLDTETAEEPAPEGEDMEAAAPEQPAISKEEMVELAGDLESLFADIDFSKGQSMSEEEEAEEEQAALEDEKDDAIEQAKSDLAQAQANLEALEGADEPTEDAAE